MTSQDVTRACHSGAALATCAYVWSFIHFFRSLNNVVSTHENMMKLLCLSFNGCPSCHIWPYSDQHIVRSSEDSSTWCFHDILRQRCISWPAWNLSCRFCSFVHFRKHVNNIVETYDNAVSSLYYFMFNGIPSRVCSGSRQLMSNPLALHRLDISTNIL